MFNTHRGASTTNQKPFENVGSFQRYTEIEPRGEFEGFRGSSFGLTNEKVNSARARMFEVGA